MERFKIEAEVREETGKGISRRLRRAGKVPGVVYGKSRSPQPLIVNPDDLKSKLNSNAIIDLTIVGDEETEETVMIKDYQKDVIKGNIIHVDFQHISMDETITITVPIKITGSALGVQEGGVLQQLIREIEIETLPADIPDEFELDISELEMGDSLQVSDLEISGEIEVKTSLDEVIVTIVAPSEEIEEEVEEELEDEFIEPEVIGEEDEEAEEAEAEDEEDTPEE